MQSDDSTNTDNLVCAFWLECIRQALSSNVQLRFSLHFVVSIFGTYWHFMVSGLSGPLIQHLGQQFTLST
jgi:hypothetical protein